MKNTIEISTGTLLKAVALILAVWFVYLVKNIFALLFIAVIIVSAIDPLVDWFQKKRIPRPAGVLIIYFFLLLAFVLSISFLIPPLANQVGELAQNYPLYYQKTQNTFGLINNFFESQHINVSTQKFFDNISDWLSSLSSNIFSTTIGVFSGLISAVAIFSIVFYMAVVQDSLKKFVILIVPQKHEKFAADLIIKIKHKIGRWMQGQIMLMLLVFAVDFIGLSLIGVPYALALAVFAGLSEIIPYIGPVISAVPGVILGFLISPVKGLLTLFLYIFTQQLENNVLAPLVMKKAVDLNPIIVILVLLAGAQLGGVLGAILAVPIAAIINITVKDFLNARGKA